MPDPLRHASIQPEFSNNTLIANILLVVFSSKLCLSFMSNLDLINFDPEGSSLLIIITSPSNESGSSRQFSMFSNDSTNYVDTLK